jgi:hypothetical protein
MIFNFNVALIGNQERAVKSWFMAEKGRARAGTAPRARAATGRLFPLVMDRRRVPLPAVHHQGSAWLRREAIREFITLGLMARYYSPKLQL